MKLRIILLLFFCSIFIFINAQQSLVDSLESIIAMNKQDVATAKSMNVVAMEYIRNDVKKAKQYLWSAILLGLQLKHDRTLSAAYSQLVTIYQNEGLLDSALVYLSFLKKISENTNGPEADIVHANYFSTAGLYHKKNGKHKDALVFFIRSYELLQRIGNIASASGQAINIGNTYLGLSDYNAALKYNLLALKGFEEIGNKKGQSFCYQNISECYTELKQYEAAFKYVRKSVQLKRELDDKRGLGNAEQALGRIYAGMKNYDKALMHYANAIALSREMKISSDEVKINFNIGKLHAERGDIEKAVSFFEKSKSLALKTGDSSLARTADLELLAGKKNNLVQEAEEQKAIDDIQSLKASGMVSKEAAGYKNLADYYNGIGQYDKALEFTNRYHQLNDSIKNTEIISRFKTIEEQYNLEKNEREIALLKKDQQIINQQLKQQRSLIIIFSLVILFSIAGIWMLVNRNKLRQQMKELELRNRIAADLHDEVGSSLSSIHLLSQMAKQQDNAAREDILNKVSTNAYETMDKMSDIVWMIKPVENDGTGLKERMERFVYECCGSRNIACTFSADDLDGIKLTMPQKKNLYLIFKEAINNAVKYSGTQTLDVKISEEQKQLKMYIKDYGKGFDEKIVLKGNGLNNMQVRTNELKGDLRISSQPDAGTSLNLSFPTA